MKKLLFITLAGLSAQYAQASWTLTDAMFDGAAFTDTGVAVADGDSVTYNANPGAAHTTTEVIGLDVNFGFVGTGSSTPTISNNINDAGTNSTGLSLTGIEGLTSFTVTATYDQLISGRTGINNFTDSLSNFPWGMGVNLIDAGTGASDTDFTTELIVDNIVRLADVDDASSASTTLNPSVTPFATDSFGSSSLSGNTLTLNSDGFIGDTFSLIRGLNDDGAGNYTATDAATYYADTFTITVTAEDTVNGFAAGADFRFSFDGDQLTSDVVPEPSSVLLLSLGGLGLALRRKR